MNKQTKGAIAACAAALLLAGGAGTMAAWNDSATIDGGAITSGTMSLTQQGVAGWTVNGTAVTDIASFKAVPGDVLVYTADFAVAAEGNNLEATLVADAASITGDLAPALDPDITVTIDGAPVPGGVLTPAQVNGKVVKAKASFAFDATGTDYQGKTADLSNFTVTLTQQ
ncbi:alternate-type signal peptide domain-containing protein [Rhodococcus sp. NPDC058505]|uniref:alternate-type signal peptide domain-containing protein n=1 Tax=unclassified Rhodococcus (in: high G+C Gram-positive bacteria) TaxID=192944 RepID=UPI003653B982